MQNNGTAKFSVEKLIHKVVTPTVFIVTHTNKEMGTGGGGGGGGLIKKIWRIFSPNSTLPSPFKKMIIIVLTFRRVHVTYIVRDFSDITTIRFGEI